MENGVVKEVKKKLVEALNLVSEATGTKDSAMIRKATRILKEAVRISRAEARRLNLKRKK